MKTLVLFSVLLLFTGSCRLTRPVNDQVVASRFVSTFPDAGAVKKFEDFTGSVVRVNAYVNYRTHVFEPDSLVTLPYLNRRMGPGMTRARLVSNESFSGTALVVSVNGNKALLLTCAHTVDFPDTVFTYDDKANTLGDRFLLAFSEKTGQVIQANGGFGSLNGIVIALDEAGDLALIEVESRVAGILPPAVKAKLAPVRDLHWGDRVWLSGYPSGKFMMTSGILSAPDNPDGVMITDASFSEGYSGAPAMVYDRVSGEFMIAGLGRSVAARSAYVLRPESRIHEMAYNTSLPYTGPAYVEIEKHTVPGITFLVSSEKIDGFLKSNAATLQRSGWTELFSFTIEQ